MEIHSKKSELKGFPKLFSDLRYQVYNPDGIVFYISVDVKHPVPISTEKDFSNETICFCSETGSYNT